MAKRHKHYGGTKKKPSPSGSKKNNQVKSKHKKIKHRRPQSNTEGGVSSWYNSSNPLGAGDLEDISIDYYNPGRAVISAKTVEDYYFGRGNGKKQSMRSGGLRPGNRHESSSSVNSLSNLGFRKRPMMFVKSTEVYDPSHDMILRLREKNSITNRTKVNVILSSDSDVDVESTVGIESATTEQVSDGSSEEEEEDDDDDDDRFSDISDSGLFFVDEQGTEETNTESIRTVHVEEIKQISKTSISRPNIEWNPSLLIGKTELNLDQDETSGSVLVNKTENKYHPFHSYVQNILQNVEASDEGDDEFEDDEPSSSEEEVDYNDDYDVGYEENDHIEILKRERNRITSPQIIQKIEKLSLQEDKLQENLDEYKSILENDEIVSEEDSEPEFGYVDEDYVINTSEVVVSNIRLGYSENSYFLQCHRLFGDYSSRWLEEEAFRDFLVGDLGLPENRSRSYFKFVKNSLIPKEETPEPTYSDIPISDSSVEEENDDHDDFNIRNESANYRISEMNNENEIHMTSDMDEGLDDLVSYSMKYMDERSQQYETRSIETKGKGKKKQLLIEEALGLDQETIETLQQKLHKRMDDKAKKRRRKEDFIDEENMNSEDLFKKYPYGLHVRNITDELELFLKRGKTTTTFPPLDPHGNKTVMKFAEHYGTKASKVGKANHTHVLVSKTKRTRYTKPNYNLIGQLLKQRPVFMRIDVKRPKEEHVRVEKIRVKSGKYQVKEGETVGKDAPEIGQENIGRRILEKLGWTSGEGLGPHGNKGISEPLMARMKKSKHGVGQLQHING
ncbi:Sqs1p NDAI_0F03780 [Naumovozyma dairenensis CBS 421]|uniref:Protein SQS1 n=1 Tax=Naumovozyma dairenensis (strain ATCC 10597 / BCRC 20456 / CBS 421 / NBRC 0211 / NRRL Y-12639) TaxID=1071378 RepID=G0WD35_NAUDC|nr:hypothetical protein NDAI_0F03780 [Naumovozyma dairenensis CBS 421]CCD25696.1 hypothetical protein NDAI_0F03780 [Naumovozyma dairenensis CBS 421]